MKYQVVFEYHTDSSAMSDVYHFSDEHKALDQFNELRDGILHAIDAGQCEVTDEPDLFSVVNREAQLLAYIRLLRE